MKITKMMLLTASIFMLCITHSCSCKVYVRKNIDASKPALSDGQPWITVWIHGISLFSPNKKDIGLKSFDELSQNKGMQRIGCWLNEYAPDRFPLENTYAYSWNGKFNFDEVEKAANQLYWSLKDLVAHYKQTYHQDPKIRIMTFSYGGNIALYLTKVPDETKLQIDELVIMGFPVSKGISKLCHDPMFKRIFNLYALLDFVQVVDPQGLVCPFASCPMFTTRCLRGNSNMIQARTMINGHSFGHFGFTGRKFLSSIGQVLDGLNQIAEDTYGNRGCEDRVVYLLNVYTRAKLAQRHIRSSKN